MPYRPRWKAGQLTSAGAQISRICALPRSAPPNGFAVQNGGTARVLSGLLHPQRDAAH
jgi:hypothetical protein